MSDLARPLIWTDAMATDIAMVDEQHQELLDIFNRLALAQAHDAAHETIISLLDELVAYTRYHFRDEEKLMLKWSVDSTHRMMHLRAHESFRGFLQQAHGALQERAAERWDDVSVEILAFLAQWLLHHIMEVDRQMARQIRARQSGQVPGESAPQAPVEKIPDARNELIATVSQLTDRLGRRTFDLLSQRQQLLDVQALYRALLHCGDVLIQSRDEQGMLESLCAKLVQETPFNTAWIGRPESSEIFSVLAFAGEGAEQGPRARPRLSDPQATSLVIRAWRSRQPEVSNDTLADPTLQSCHAEFRVHRWHSAVAIPVLRGGEIWAILALASPRRECFDVPTVEVCSRVAALLGHGLDEFDLKHRIRTRQVQDARIARTDVLTDLPNRLALEEYLPQAIARARRHGTTLAVGVIDLDDFKPVNDQLGHEAGDQLLRAIARGLLQWLRESDFIARLGGDEFVVVLEDLETPQALSQLGAALDRLHRAVETPFELGASERASIDMTMGVALFPRDGEDADLLLRQADAAMYQAKQSKRSRTRWWRIGVTTNPEKIAEVSFDAFGPEARAFMLALAPHLPGVAEQFSESFYRELHAHPETSAILKCLSPEELKALARKQAAHVRELLDAEATGQQVHATARQLGVVHALIGVSGAWMTRAMGLYRDLLRTHLDAALLTARTRYRTLRAAEARLQLDVESQLQAIQTVLDQYQTLLSRPMEGRALAADWMQSELNALAELPGVRAAVVFRPDADNRLVIERAAGRNAQALVAAHTARELFPVLDPRDVRGRGLVSATWMTDSQQETAAYWREERLEPWVSLLQEFGIRSGVALPVHRHGAIHAVLLIYGAYPHQFSSGWMHTWRLSLQNRWDQMTRASQSRGLAIDNTQATQIRSLLYGGGVEMWVQPVVDLRDGTLVKVEALARLRGDDGSLLSPAQFLPALGESDLDALFRQGLKQSLAHLRGWRDARLPIALSINLAPSSLVHPDCARWVEEALREAQVAPEHLTLEVLESQALEAALVDEAITRLAAVGVKIAMDDLGSGFSNLKRLADLPFDVIKIDQNIIKDLARDPVKALSLIRTVVQIGEDLERDVVAEGLEDAGIIEAAIVLGCHFGQGYALARPMPPEALVQWLAQRTFRGGDGRTLHSWLGALAYQWRVMHDPLHVQRPGELAACPISHFLQAQQVKDEQVLWLHACIHEHPAETERMQAMRQLMKWIAGKVCES